MIHYSNHPPNVKDYCELRAKAGMSPKSETAAQNQDWTKLGTSIVDIVSSGASVLGKVFGF